MAKRINLNHMPDVRAKIQSSQLINRLQGHANGTVELSPTQVNAAKILLGKTVPDLSSVTLEGNPDKPLHTAMPLADQELINRYLTQKEKK